MAGTTSKIQGVQSVSSTVTANEARSLIEQIGSGLPVGTPIKTIQDHVARLVKMPVRRIRAFWNGEVHRPYADEIEALRREAARRKRQAEINEHAGRNELAELRCRLSSIEAFLASGDADFHGPQAAAYRAALRGLAGASDSAVDGR